MRPVRIGIIGCGRVLSGPYRPVIGRLLDAGHAEVAIACDVDPGRREFVQDTFAADRFTTNDVDVFDADDVDLVLVLTPPATHAALVIRGLEAGKHVLVEKPVALSMADADAVLAAARRSPRHLICAPFVTLSPTFRAMAATISSGRIGRILTARSIYGWSGPNWGAWFYRGQGGGPLFDLGVYNLTSITGLIGPVRRVTAMSGIAVPERIVDGARLTPEVDDNFQIALDHGDGVFSSLTTSFAIQQLRTPAIELYGTEGTIQMLGADWQPDGFELWENAVGAWTLVPESDPTWDYADGLGHLVATIRGENTLAMDPEHAVHVLDVMLLALEAGRDGVTHDVTTTFHGTHRAAGG